MSLTRCFDPTCWSARFRDRIGGSLIIRPQRRRAQRNLRVQHIGCMSQPQHTELLCLSFQQLTEVAEGFGQAPYRVRQLLDGLYRQRWAGLEQFTTLPLVFRQRLIGAGYEVGLPQIEKKFVSADGTIRYLLAFSDGQSVENVWMPEVFFFKQKTAYEMGDAELRDLSISDCHPQQADAGFASASRRPPIVGSLSAHSYPQGRMAARHDLRLQPGGLCG